MPNTDESQILTLCGEAAILQKQGLFGDVIKCYRKALEIKADIPELYKNLGDAYRSIGDVQSAITAYKHAIAYKPGYAAALNNLGLTYHNNGNYSDAVQCYKAAIGRRPDLAGTLGNLRTSFQKLGRIADAISVHLELLKSTPHSAQAHSSLGICYALARDFERAEAAFIMAITLDPELSEAHEGLADVLSVTGQIDRAREHYKKCVDVVPFRAHLFYKLAFHGGFQSGGPLLSKLQRRASDPGSLNTNDQILAHFALSKAFEDVQRFDEAFHHLRLGAALKRSTILYDEAEEIARMHRVKTPFSAGLIKSKQGLGHPSTQPVFIVGMPRSGSTLLEQVLAGHPDIATVGESNQFALAVARRPEIDYRNLANLDRESLIGLGHDYLVRIGERTPPKTYIVDKTLSNFWSVGLIHLVFPAARIIHIVRSPMDVCFSCYSTLFDSGHKYSYDLRELGRYYRVYRRMMAHWRTVIPENAIVDVVYDEFVSSFESSAKKLLDVLGLNWYEDCLHFYRSQRAVHTASLVQVRKPVYKDSIGRWVRYRNMLAPLEDELRACE